MKKTTLAVTVVLAGAVAGGLYWGISWTRARLAPPAPELRATQQDEDAVPVPVPDVSVLLNGEPEAAVVRNGPLSVSVAVTHRHAANVGAKLALLRARAGRLAGQARRSPADAQALQRATAAVAALEAAARLTLGDAAHPWPDAIQVTLKPAAGGEAAPWALRRLAAYAPAPAILDAENSAELHLAPEPGPWASLAAGRYEVRACLGTACSDPATLTVMNSDADLTQQQRDNVDRHAARVALLAKDWAELERRGKALLGRDKLAAHTALGDAYFGQQKWDQALAEYTAARQAWPRKNGDVPRALNLRISRLIETLGAEQ